MSFKIVATPTRRGLSIALCPSSWETEGVLKWPPKNINLLQRNAESEPEDHWDKYQCTVKKRDIPTYTEALKWEKAIQLSDTDGEAELTVPLSMPMPMFMSQKGKKTTSYDRVFQELQPLLAEESTCISAIPSTSNSTYTRLLAEESTSLLAEERTSVPKSYTVNLEIREDIKTLKYAVDRIETTQTVQHIKILTLLERFFKEKATDTIDNPAPVLEDILTKHKLPVETLEKLKELDLELNTNREYFKATEQHFNNYIGVDGQGRGETLGRNMAEQIMTRDLMTKMSWTGVSRTPGLGKKFSFQSLDTLCTLFYKVLSRADSRWNQKKNEKLFSGSLLKHANKRAMAEKIKIMNKRLMNNQEGNGAGYSNHKEMMQQRFNNHEHDLLMLPEHPDTAHKAAEMRPEHDADAAHQAAEMRPEQDADVAHQAAEMRPEQDADAARAISEYFMVI